MSLTEGAALRVLPGQADRRSLDQQRGERQRLRVRPLDALFGHEHVPTPLELLLQLGMHREAVRHREQLLVEPLERLGVDGGGGLGRALALDALRLIGALS